MREYEYAFFGFHLLKGAAMCAALGGEAQAAMAAAEPGTGSVQKRVGGGLGMNPVTRFSLHILRRVVCLAVVPLHITVGGTTCVSVRLVCQCNIAMRSITVAGPNTPGLCIHCHRDECHYQNRQQQHQHCHTIAPFLQILSFLRVFSSQLGTMFLIIHPF